MATEGRTQVGTEWVRTLEQSTQAGDEAAPSVKNVEPVILTDPDTPANVATVRADGSVQVGGTVSQASGTGFSGSTVNTSGTANQNTVLLAAAVGTRHGLVITNAGTGILTIGYGFTTSATLWTYKLNPSETLEVPPAFAGAAINGQSTVATQPVTFTIATGPA